MPDTLAELRALVADLRTVLTEADLRGVVAEAADEQLPPSVAPEPRVEPVARTSRPVVASSWAKLADKGRAVAEQESLRGAAGLERVRAELGDCRRCNLCTHRQQIVFGAGDPDADLVIVGEAPGYHEDRQGVPFVGQAGQMLDRMLLNVLGLERAEVHILNVVKCRPPDNRNPLPDEVAACMPFLKQQIDAIDPKVVLVLGTVALKSLLGGSQGITARRGRWHELNDVPVLPSFHPAYLLRNPAGKRDAFADLKALTRRYDELGGKRTLPTPGR